MTRKSTIARIACGLVVAMALVPGMAFAADDAPGLSAPAGGDSPVTAQDAPSSLAAPLGDITTLLTASAASQLGEAHAMLTRDAAKADMLLAYDQAHLDAIGTQESTGHTICCPSFSCAYADAVLDGTVHDHEYYTCSCCTWTDWGGGDSSDRCVGSDEELLREAYDQISAGKPTVIHVAWEGGEHWIALIGYENATDPDHLTLGNFIALDPWDGALLNAGSKYSLYGDGCEHISDR